MAADQGKTSNMNALAIMAELRGVTIPEAGTTRFDVLLDEGDFGWEPTLYIVAHNPLELVDRTHQLTAILKQV